MLVEHKENHTFFFGGAGANGGSQPGDPRKDTNDPPHTQHAKVGFIDSILARCPSPRFARLRRWTRGSAARRRDAGLRGCADAGVRTRRAPSARTAPTRRRGCGAAAARRVPPMERGRRHEILPHVLRAGRPREAKPRMCSACCNLQVLNHRHRSRFSDRT
mgnify:CR=1 FL=1